MKVLSISSKVESIQHRAVKWILGEQDHHYNDIEYLTRLRELDLMPMELKFEYKDGDLLLFHQINNDQSVLSTESTILFNSDHNQ